MDAASSSSNNRPASGGSVGGSGAADGALTGLRRRRRHLSLPVGPGRHNRRSQSRPSHRSNVDRGEASGGGSGGGGLREASGGSQEDQVRSQAEEDDTGSSQRRDEGQHLGRDGTRRDVVSQGGERADREEEDVSGMDGRDEGVEVPEEEEEAVAVEETTAGGEPDGTGVTSSSANHANAVSTSTDSDAKRVQKWKCDVCHVALFDNFEEAVEHEANCNGNPSAAPAPTETATSTSTSNSNVGDDAAAAAVPVPAAAAADDDDDDDDDFKIDVAGGDPQPQAAAKSVPENVSIPTEQSVASGGMPAAEIATAEGVSVEIEGKEPSSNLQQEVGIQQHQEEDEDDDAGNIVLDQDEEDGGHDEAARSETIDTKTRPSRSSSRRRKPPTKAAVVSAFASGSFKGKKKKQIEDDSNDDHNEDDHDDEEATYLQQHSKARNGRVIKRSSNASSLDQQKSKRLSLSSKPSSSSRSSAGPEPSRRSSPDTATTASSSISDFARSAMEITASNFLLNSDRRLRTPPATTKHKPPSHQERRRRSSSGDTTSTINRTNSQQRQRPHRVGANYDEGALKEPPAILTATSTHRSSPASLSSTINKNEQHRKKSPGEKQTDRTANPKRKHDEISGRPVPTSAAVIDRPTVPRRLVSRPFHDLPVMAQYFLGWIGLSDDVDGAKDFIKYDFDKLVNKLFKDWMEFPYQQQQRRESSGAGDHDDSKNEDDADFLVPSQSPDPCPITIRPVMKTWRKIVRDEIKLIDNNLPPGPSTRPSRESLDMSRERALPMLMVPVAHSDDGKGSPEEEELPRHASAGTGVEDARSTLVGIVVKSKCDGRTSFGDFMDFLDINDCQSFLRFGTQDLARHLKEWRRQNGMPLADNTALQYCGAWKTAVRKAVNVQFLSLRLVDAVLDPAGKEFVSSLETTDPEEFLVIMTTRLGQALREWRASVGMSDLTEGTAQTYIGGWKTEVRHSLAEHRVSAAPNIAPLPPSTSSSGRRATASVTSSVQSRDGKDFAKSINVTEPIKFLKLKTGDLGSIFNSWRKAKGLEPVSDKHARNRVSKWKGEIREHLSKPTTRLAVGYTISDIPNPRAQGLAVKANEILLGWEGVNESRSFSTSNLEEGSKDDVTMVSRLLLHAIPAGISQDFLCSLAEMTPNEFMSMSTIELAQKLMLWRKFHGYSQWNNNTAMMSISRWQRNAARNIELAGVEDHGCIPIRASASNTWNLFDEKKRPLLEFVDNETKTIYIDQQTQLPTFEFSVRDDVDKDLIYDFRVNAAPSKIVNSGNGAFLAYLGARRWYHPVGNYIPEPATDFVSRLSIDLGPYGPFRESDRKIWWHYELKNFLFRGEPSEWGFEVEEKTEEGDIQVVDITDDSTGMPHGIAQSNIPMHVNETGGDETLVENIFPGQKNGCDVHYYFKSSVPISPGQTIELLVNYQDEYESVRERKGYGKLNKEGKVKSDEHLPSLLQRNFLERCDVEETIFPLGIRNFHQLLRFLVNVRAQILVKVDGCLEAIESGKTPASLPYSQQLVGLRRLEWLVDPTFTSHLARLSKFAAESDRVSSNAEEGNGESTTNTGTDQDSSARLAVSKLFEEGRDFLEQLRWPKWDRLLTVLNANPDLVDDTGESFSNAFETEMIEEITFPSRFMLLYPMDESTWCPVAQDLTRKLCAATASHLWSKNDKNPQSDLSELKAVYMQRTLEAAEKVKNPTNLKDLAIERGVWQRFDLEHRKVAKDAEAGEVCVVTYYGDGTKPEPIILDEKEMNLSNTDINTNWYLIRQVAHVACSLAVTYFNDDLVGRLHMWVEELCLKLEIKSPDVYGCLQSGIFVGKNDRSFVRPAPMSTEEKTTLQEGWLLDLRGKKLGRKSSAERHRAQAKSKSIGVEHRQPADAQNSFAPNEDLSRHRSQLRQKYVSQILISQDAPPDDGAQPETIDNPISAYYHSSTRSELSRNSDRKRRRLPDGSLIPKTLPPRNADGTYPVPRSGRRPPNLVWHPTRGLWVPPRVLHDSTQKRKHKDGSSTSNKRTREEEEEDDAVDTAAGATLDEDDSSSSSSRTTPSSSSSSSSDSSSSDSSPQEPSQQTMQS
eukprot:CAMPEP_0113495608 /NCGR_PEP_ID=MMETSP0014_2-20120614/29697_1 /TAXON_ID=2857 /ORGANISM="Nitzschia sp." /LENGTH=2073 /DNA_ID=CAMNT_0000389511 /DNA_START=205 /DNA_END=6426 /DNA_ORIENTATION=- /assembly_acc=CAM_ASM_000159